MLSLLCILTAINVYVYPTNCTIFILLILSLQSLQLIENTCLVIHNSCLSKFSTSYICFFNYPPFIKYLIIKSKFIIIVTASYFYFYICKLFQRVKMDSVKFEIYNVIETIENIIN